MIQVLVIILLTLITGSIVFFTVKNGISPMPSSGYVKGYLIRCLKELNIKGEIVELGSGWGTIAFEVAKNFPHSKVVGFENSHVPYYISKLILFFIKVPNLNLTFKNFFKTNLSHADVIICYLYPGAMKKLEEKFKQELTKNTIIISHTFALPNKTPIHTIELNDLYRTKIYIYKT